ncbi:phage tail protein [uncultured Photobacterium sp.]|uniref:phage tail protein n=1 Tax=uncultured Photobacterium sp. TaxID=173973 RepID=UPI00260EE171|nr:tail fiber protein [uncultured Photobacterium sp.]
MADPFIGEISLFSFNFNPRGWFLCNGSLLPIANNTTLFSLLGTMYGGDGRTTFALPDLRGRVPMNKGRHPGSYYDWRMGQQAGSETHTLTIPELAAHSHTATFTATGGEAPNVTINATNEPGTESLPSEGAYLAAATAPSSGPDKNELIYKMSPSSGSLVALGGVEVKGGGATGVVTVDPNGATREFSILQPTLALNYCLAHVGTYPPRS